MFWAQSSNNVVYSFETVVITSILQKMNHFEDWYCEVWILFPQKNIWSEAQHCSQHVLEEVML